MTRTWALAGLILLATTPHPLAQASCVSQTAQNPITLNEERVVLVHDGHDFEIEWSEQISGVWVNQYLVTQNTNDDSCPHLSFFPDGSTAVVWREDGAQGQIKYRARNLGNGAPAWQAAAISVSGGVSNASVPWAVVHDGTPWVAWHEATASGIQLMGGGGDYPTPWPTRFISDLIAIPNSTVTLALTIESESGHLWVTWIDSASAIGYSEWSSETEAWEPAGSEPYANPADIPAARQRVRDAILE